MNTSIYKHIKSLPPLDDTVIKIQSICADENSTAAGLAKVVEKDPMLTANILRSANSPLYGFSREINDISRAISLFGMATIRGFALSSAVKKSFQINLKPYGISDADFLNISTMQNALMYNWYTKVNPSALYVLSAASFMLEIGKIVFAHELIETGKGDEFRAKLTQISTTEELLKLENATLEIADEVVAAKIFEQWNLEAELVEAIAYISDPSQAPKHIEPYSVALKVVRSAVNIFHRLDDTSIQSALVIIDKHGLSRDKFLEAVAKVKANL